LTTTITKTPIPRTKDTDMEFNSDVSGPTFDVNIEKRQQCPTPGCKRLLFWGELGVGSRISIRCKGCKQTHKFCVIG